MTQEEHISISVWLSGRSYRIRIKPQEEATVREAVKQADEKLAELKMNYAGKDDQDFMAMCLLMYAAAGQTAAGTHTSATSPALQEDILSLISRIDDVITD